MKFVLFPIGRAEGFQVTDEFIAQLPKQLIVPNSHLQISKSIGQGKKKLYAVLVGVKSFFYNPCSLISSPPNSFLSLHFAEYGRVMESWAGQTVASHTVYFVQESFCTFYILCRRVWSCLQSKAVEKTRKK